MELPNRKSIRLKDYDYTKEGGYFITICTEKRQQILGRISMGIKPEMISNKNGVIVKEVVESLANRYPIDIPVYQIMPNHTHMIIIIDDNPSHFTLGNIIAYFKYQSTKQINNIVGVGFSNPPPINVSKQGRENPAPTDYKYPKIFQRNYFEHVIRDEKDYQMISEYIVNNPLLWDRDRNNPEAKKDLTEY